MDVESRIVRRAAIERLVGQICCICSLASTIRPDGASAMTTPAGICRSTASSRSRAVRSSSSSCSRSRSTRLRSTISRSSSSCLSRASAALDLGPVLGRVHHLREEGDRQPDEEVGPGVRQVQGGEGVVRGDEEPVRGEVAEDQGEQRRPQPPHQAAAVKET